MTDSLGARDGSRVGDAAAAAELAASAVGLWRGAPLHGLPDTAWVSAEPRLDARRAVVLVVGIPGAGRTVARRGEP